METSFEPLFRLKLLALGGKGGCTFGSVFIFEHYRTIEVMIMGWMYEVEDRAIELVKADECAYTVALLPSLFPKQNMKRACISAGVEGRVVPLLDLPYMIEHFEKLREKGNDDKAA